MKFDNAKRGDIIEVEWWDSCQNTGWQPERDVIEWAETGAKAIHHSIGYFVKVNEQVVILVGSYADFDSGRSVTDTMSIPLVAVVRAWILK